MFSFFSRKQQQPTAEPSKPESDVIAVGSVPQQLRTPSPSEAAYNGLSSAARITMTSSEPSTSKLALPPTPEALHTLVTTIPPKTLHAYVLSHIPAAPPDTLTTLASFFATLAPPPLIHCVRCHADYTEVENTDRSCRVPHDDESANVEWVGRSRGGSEYETFYGCCGQTVEGEGDLGPPNGWCYEGMHTTDTKRARFRADSTPAEDMLVSCLQLNCHNIRTHLPKASASPSIRNKRARPSLGDGDAADDRDGDGDSEGTEDTGIAEIARGVGALGGDQKGAVKSKGKGKARAKPKADAAATSSTPARGRARVRMQTPRAQESDAEGNKRGSPSAATPSSAPASRKRRPIAKPRSTAASPLASAITRKRAAAAAAAATGSESELTGSPKPRGRKPRSSVAKMDSVEIVVRSPSRTRSRARGSGAETADEKKRTVGEGRARKRRKVAGAGAA